ncbi:MAG: glycoside hydrolase domain-containing protein, partial [Candidatus Ventricola sp.]
MLGILSTQQEFLFPDTPLGPLSAQLRVVSARNGRVGVQIMFACAAECGSVSVCGSGFDASLYELVDVPVEYNTGDGVNQGGAMVILPETCPDYAIRRAPFRVYDCLRPLCGPDVPSRSGRVSAYLTLAPKADTPAGEHKLSLTLRAGEETHICSLTYVVYPVTFDEDLFETTNWFSVRAMEQMHGVTLGTKAFEEIVRAYARSMRSVHQKVFLLWMHEDLSERRAEKPYAFDFEDMAPIIRIFFEEGFDTFETGGIIFHGYRKDGTQDMFTADLKCRANPAVSVDSEEGYALLCAEMQAFAEFLTRHGWMDRVLFHVMDEPDVHYQTDAVLQARRVQFMLASNIVRRYLPGVRILEAVKT